MKHSDTHNHKPAGLTLSALAAAALIASGGALSAQTTFTMPTDICTWDWSSPATGSLLAALKDQNLLAHTAVEMARTCPEKLCELDWQSGAAGANLPGEMLCELGHRQLFFAPLVEGLAATCPGVAQMMTDRLPEVYGSCGTWPRVTPGGTSGTGKCQELNGEYENGKRPPRECYEGEGDGPEPPAIGPGGDFDL